jgi:hypothetical protein
MKLLSAPALALAFALEAHAVALTPAEVAAACGDAEGLAHCGRMVEEIQLKRLPGLASRNGSTLDVTLYPSGKTSFTDTEGRAGERAYSLWDYFDALNAVVLYVARGDDASFLILQRTNGRTFELPAEPKLAPDRQRVATADFCAAQCVNEVALWRIDRQSVRKEASFTPSERWSDASVQWKSTDVLAIEYTREGESAPHTIERRLNDPVWKRVAP